MSTDGAAPSKQHVQQNIANLTAGTGTTVQSIQWIAAEDMAALLRFQECCEDSDAGGHDVPKEQMRRLTEIGLVWPVGFGRHQITSFGNFVLASHMGEPHPLPLTI